jgi:DNA-binding SARP family transcriptional activator
LSRTRPQVQLFGSAQVEHQSGAVLFRDDKRFWLLAYLAFKSDWVSREQLANLFWSDTDSSSARKILRHLIQRTRALEWLTGFESELEHVRWLVPTDVSEFRRALEESAWDQALLAYKGIFLNGFRSGDSPEFADWLEIERESLQTKWHRASLNQARVLIEHGVYSEALRILEGLLKHDPLDEIALESLMRVAARDGQNDLALRSFKGFSARLEHDLNLPPPAKLEQLAQTYANTSRHRRHKQMPYDAKLLELNALIREVRFG